ncbi:class I SAM-dependent methyltransferase [Salicibibacter cibarius]|uniref:Class I SAM-dependent methyltransferase n=1 Tax=Salicibibacter cibarius TaxID=2743000 RepID=A0A7T6Z3F4_9BACI|nr:class I SAM-dependent methyltransferase [Salicibibacter cibarius]QQK76303.1 class I SAM-dependent methyltransferase [Salicibibacter cibarius]
MYTIDMEPLKVIVTTSRYPTPEMQTRAWQLAKRFRCPYETRFRKTMTAFLQKAETVYMVGKDGRDRLYEGNGNQPLFFHPSMAKIRVQRLMAGEVDSLISVAGLRSGDAFLDMTLGFGADSIVASYAVTTAGCVTAVEKSPYIAEVMARGLHCYQEDVEALNEAMRRISVVQNDHHAYLRSMPANSFDVVYFDPMFTHTHSHSAHIEPLRAFADAGTLHEAVLEEAKKVAKRAVVLKAERDSLLFERFQFDNVRKHRTVSYGTMHMGGGQKR